MLQNHVTLTRPRITRVCICLTTALASVLLLASGVAAQSRTAEVAGGYAFLRDPDVSSSFPSGWFVAGGGKLEVGKFRKDWFGVVGELTANYRNISPLGQDITLISYSFMGGPKFTARQWKQLLPSGQFLAGGAIERVTSTQLALRGSVTHFAFEPGGALDFIVAPRLAVRAGMNERLVVMRGHITAEPQLLVGVAFWK